ncbi:MAG: PspA/IM30 family protein [Phycisphaerae bacterium]
MGIIRNLQRITRARIEAYLDSVETPELLLPRLLDELAEKVRLASDAEAKALSAVKGTQRRMDEANGRIARLQRGAKLAMEAGEDDTARAAVAAQIEAEQAGQAVAAELEGAQQAHVTARQTRLRLQEDLQNLRSRRQELMGRWRSARGGRQAGRAAMAAALGGGVLDEVARMEAKVDEAEAQVQIADEISRTLGDVLPEQDIEEIGRDEEIERRLRELRRQ